MNKKTTDKINRTINLARKVPFYRQKLKDIYNRKSFLFEDLPFTTKDELTNLIDYKQLLNEDYYDSKTLLQGRSSGTTGKPSTIYVEPTEMTRSLQELWFYRRKWYNIISGKDKIGFFNPTNTDFYLSENITDKQIALSKNYLNNEKDTLLAIKKLYQYKPDYLIIQPSVMIILHEVIIKYKQPLFDFIKYVEFNGEFLEPNVEKLTQEICPNAKISNQYGLQEVQSVAFRCPCGHMHLMTNNCYTEIVNKDENNIGDICITTYNQKAMPYIRFITGDKGKINNNIECQYSKNPVLTITRGRDNDFIMLENGKTLHPYKILQIMDMINYSFKQYRITQTDINTFIFEIVLIQNTQPLKDKIELWITKNLNNILNTENVNVDFKYSKIMLPDRKTGKQTIFINTMKR